MKLKTKKTTKTSTHLLETTTRKTNTKNVNNAPEEEIQNIVQCNILYIKPHETLHSHRNINRDHTQATQSVF